MTTCQEIKEVARIIYPSSIYPGCYDVSPPVRLIHQANTRRYMAYLINPDLGTVLLVGETGFRSLKHFTISAKQGRATQDEITGEMLDELEEFLNHLADERDSDGKKQTHNAKIARDMLDKWGMMRRKSEGCMRGERSHG